LKALMKISVRQLPPPDAAARQAYSKFRHPSLRERDIIFLYRTTLFFSLRPLPA
jgi:hypothetical protein